MSTSKDSSTPSTGAKAVSAGVSILNALAGANEYVALGLQIGQTVLPLVKGAITAIKSIGAKQDTVTYQVLLQVDGAELDAIDKLAWDDLLAINAELAARNVPQISLPAQPSTSAASPAASGPAADPAPGTSSST